MNDSNRDVLRRYHDDLARDIIVTEDLLGDLYTHGVFQKDMIEIIRAQSTPDKIHKMLELLPKRGPDALDKFIGVIECSYPWLATVLTSAKVKIPIKNTERVTKTPGISHHSKAMSRSNLDLDDQQWSLVDGDIKKIVTAFVHRQFGQSKRISEKDKKSVERFMADQIQRERTRYQSILTSTSSTPSSRAESCMDNNVFQASQVQENLYLIHRKLERYILKSTKNSRLSDAKLATTSHDDDGHPDYKHQSQQHDALKKEEIYQYQPKLAPEDMDFDILNKEVDIVVKQVDMHEDTIKDCFYLFDSRDRRHPLSSLVENVMAQLDQQKEDLKEDRQQIRQLLDQVQHHTEYIERLEKERLEHRKQIQAAYLDMASLRQEKCAFQERVSKLEKEKRQWQQEESGKARVTGIVSKSMKSTPRGGSGTSTVHTMVGMTGSRNYNYGGSRNVTNLVATGVTTSTTTTSSEDGYSKKPGTQRAGNAYLSYARRYPREVSKYGSVSKRRGKMDSSPTNFNSTTKF